MVGRLRVVRHDDDRFAVFSIQKTEQIENFVGRVAVEVARWFITNEQRRIGDQRACDGDPLLLSTRQLAGLVTRAIGKTDDLQRRGGILLACARFSRVSSSGADCAARSTRQQVVELKHEADVSRATSCLRSQRFQLTPPR
jgi:hypothetical protein